jgi:hypothetical protein
MKKYLLPSALILALAAGLAFAQTINRAMQLSQDASGAFGVDTNNNIYFPGHILSTGPGTPVLTSCGTTPTIAGSDTAGLVTTGTTNTGCVVTFNKAYLAVPWCVVVSQSPAATPAVFVTAATGINITLAANSSVKVNYFCSGSS